mmetsp:Transcript_15617/g.48892  ORF Transcript_15617/g.48892 Transcript_15617/m.48892 type:complete len:422 (-) Transcript_15617:42-1307(-)
MGGLLLFLLLALLIGPIVYFSSLNKLMLKPNRVVSGELSVALEIRGGGASRGGWVQSLQLYKAQAHLVDVPENEQLLRREAVGGTPVTVQKVAFPTSSDSLWMVSPSARQEVARVMVKDGVEANIVLGYVFEREATGVRASGRDVARLAFKTIRVLADMLKAESLDQWGDNLKIVVEDTFIPEKRLTSSATISGPDEDVFVVQRHPVQLQISNDADGGLPYWSLFRADLGQCEEKQDEHCRLECWLTNDDIASAGSGRLSVNGLYVGVVLTIGNFLRLIFHDSSKRVIYEEVPDTDLLLDLCDGIYLARIQGNLDIEYKLYYELIRIYRSPELLARISEPRALSMGPRLPTSNTGPGGALLAKAVVVTGGGGSSDSGSGPAAGAGAAQAPGPQEEEEEPPMTRSGCAGRRKSVTFRLPGGG